MAFPLLLLILGVLQVGIYFMTKSALDTGVILTAETLRKGFNSGTAGYTTWSGCALRTQVASNSGTFITDDATTLFAEIQPLSNLDPALLPINTTCGKTDYGSGSTPTAAGSVLVLRAKYTPPSFLPGFAPSVTLYSSAIVRKQLY